MKLSLLLFLTMLGFTKVISAFAGGYTPPTNNRIDYNLNYDWKFIKSNVSGADAKAFNDASWTTVTLPHTCNDVDFWNTWITGSGHYGWSGIMWYRKHFKLDSTLKGRKVFVEFERIKQAGIFYINGNPVGIHEDGVSACGIDISQYVVFGATENVLSVEVDNTLGYKEIATATNFVWNTPPFYPQFGGIVGNVKLHVTDQLYQTFPLYRNLGTSGSYVYAKNINVSGKSADVTVEAEVTNSYATDQTVDYMIDIVDVNGVVIKTSTLAGTVFKAGETKRISQMLSLTGIELWSPNYPYIYQVYTYMKIGDKVVDQYQTPLGIRTFTWTLATGLMCNGAPLYLNGYAPRSTMEWPAIGQAPNWMEEYDLKLMKGSNGNFIRPMHVTPKPSDVDAADKVGIIYTSPAGDAEGDSWGIQWTQRLNLMRDNIIYNRNHPSVVFYEGGNQNLFTGHMQAMVDLRKQWDPNGGRFAGTRSTSDSLKNISEYMSSMDAPTATSYMPTYDSEYARAESPRRVWDKYSPPSFGYKNIADTANSVVEYPTDGFIVNSCEDLARNNVKKYFDRWSKRGGQGLAAVCDGGAKIIFADGVSHGRVVQTEMARVSGVTDGARLPKSSYYAMRVAQSSKPDIAIIGHWSYPTGTVKNVYVIANTDAVGLQTYDKTGKLIKDYGMGTQANVFEFGFTNVAFNVGKIVATGYNGGVAVISQEVISAGTPKSLKITPIVGPKGLIADGSDVAMFDVEAVDSMGVRCPTQQGLVTFTYSGQAAYLGGYNSGRQYSNYKDTLLTECGINRVFARATRTAGTFTINATSPGLTPGTASVTSTPITVIDGLAQDKPQSYDVVLVKSPVDPFGFINKQNVELSTVYISDTITVTGMSTPQAIKITFASTGAAATYSINGAAFTSAVGMISSGDKLCVKLTSNALYATTNFATIDINGVVANFSVTTKIAPKVLPNLAYKKPITASSIQGTFTPNNIVDGIATGGRWAGLTNTYPQSVVVNLLAAYNVDSVDILPYSNRAYKYIVEGSIDSTKWFTLSDQSANTVGGVTISQHFTPQVAKYIRLTIVGCTGYTGGYTSLYEFRVFEAPKNTKPNPFVLGQKTGLELFSSGTSDPVIISGIEAPADILILNSTEVSSYSINNGPFVSNPGLVVNGDTVRVKLGTGSVYSNTYTLTLSIGGVTADFKTITKDLPTGISTNSIDNMLCYPSPTNGLVNVEIPDDFVSGHLEIISINGQLIDKLDVINGHLFLDMSFVNSGIYYINITNSSKNYHAKVVVVH